MTGSGYILEDSPDGRTLVVTGPWTRQAAEVLATGEADGLVLNYARGFCEGDLEFLDGWAVRRLELLDRGLPDLGPIGRLGDSLEEISVQASPRAELDLTALPRLRSVAGEWGLIRDTLGCLDALEALITWRFNESDLHSLRLHCGLERLTIKEAPFLESLSGVGDLRELLVLGVILARRLRDISNVDELAASLEELELQGSPSIDALDNVEPLLGLRFLAFSDCGDIESLAPIGTLEHLEALHAWGTTRVVDDDLSPLARLPRVREIRMRDRRSYKPRVADLVAALAT